MKLLVIGLFVAVLAVIYKTPVGIRFPLSAAFIALCIIVGIWRRAEPAPPAKWDPPRPFHSDG